MLGAAPLRLGRPTAASSGRGRTHQPALSGRPAPSASHRTIGIAASVLLRSWNLLENGHEEGGAVSRWSCSASGSGGCSDGTTRNDHDEPPHRPLANGCRGLMRAIGGGCLLMLANVLTAVAPASAAPSGRNYTRGDAEPLARVAPKSTHDTWRDTGMQLAAAPSSLPPVMGPLSANARLLQDMVRQQGDLPEDDVLKLEEAYNAQHRSAEIADQLSALTVVPEAQSSMPTRDASGELPCASALWADLYSSEDDQPTFSLRMEAGEFGNSQSGRPSLPYRDFLALVADGLVSRVALDSSDSAHVLALLSPGAPGGERTVAVDVGSCDAQLLDLLRGYGVQVEHGLPEQERIASAFMAQFHTYMLPFLALSAIYWAWHGAVLDPMPNAFRRKEFLRYRREMLYVASKLNFRSPAREVRIDMEAPDFIAWDDINGIDAVKKEIVEIIDYLKNPAKQRKRGVNRIGGVLLAGAPGTGKTLLAKSIAAESGVKMFTCSGTDFFDVYTGVGARRVRETFENMRNAAPAILFVDEFDALGAARGAAASGDESTSIINELLVQMDGFEDNQGIVVLGATNRPGAIDSALIRPGRFDRIVYMPLPDAKGRSQILQVHARDKHVDPSVNWFEVARSMAGFTGADCMGLMQRAVRMAARQGREQIQEEDLYAAMEDKAVEAYIEMTGSPSPGQDAGVPDPLPGRLRRAVAVYEAGKALLAYITPEFEEIARVSICPGNIIMGYTLFLEDEEKSMDTVVTRSDLESHMVVNLGGACAEKLLMGEDGATSLGSADVFQANMIAREMILSMGMGATMGPVDLMHTTAASADAGAMMRKGDPMMPSSTYNFHATDMSTEQARVAMAEVVSVLESAEAKAYYGLAINWRPLLALADALEQSGSLKGKEVVHILESNGLTHFVDPYIIGFGWDASDGGRLTYPLKSVQIRPHGKDMAVPDTAPVLSGVRAKTWYAGTPLDAPRNPDGSFKYGWHWNMPYTIKRNLSMEGLTNV